MNSYFIRILVLLTWLDLTSICFVIHSDSLPILSKLKQHRYLLVWPIPSKHKMLEQCSLMLAHRLRQRPNNKTTSGKFIGFAGLALGQRHWRWTTINPLSPHDALKHHFTSLKTVLISLKPKLLICLIRKFLSKCFTNTWQFSVIFKPHKS